MYAERSRNPQKNPKNARELAGLISENDPLTKAIVRDVSKYLGEAIGYMVNILNPARVVLTGFTTTASDEMLAGVRAAVYEKARPLATRMLNVAYPTLGIYAGIGGASILGIERILSANFLGRL